MKCWKIGWMICFVIGLMFGLGQMRSWASDYSNRLFHDLPGKPVAQQQLWSSSADVTYPVRLSWGSYRVVITRDDDNLGDEACRLSINNSRGRVIKQIKAFCIQKIGLINITGRKPRELYIQAAPMVNIQSCRRAYYFTQSPDVHALMTTVNTFDAIHRLPNGHVVCAVESVAPMEGPWGQDVSISHAECPETAIVGEIQNGRFVLLNRSYPKASTCEALKYQQGLRKPSEFDTAWMGFSIGYYANMSAIGRSAEALHWLRRHLNAEQRSDFRRALPTIKRLLLHLPQVVWKSDRRVYGMNNSGDYYFPDR